MKRGREQSQEDGASIDVAPVTFTKPELWLLRHFIRHEVPAMETWHFPPAGIDLNDQIAAALLLCEEQKEEEATLQLSWGDCLAIDYCVPDDAKDVNGALIGRKVLLKTYRARADIRRGYPFVDAPEPAGDPASSDVAARLRTARWLEDEQRYQSDHNPGADAGYRSDD